MLLIVDRSIILPYKYINNGRKEYELIKSLFWRLNLTNSQTSIPIMDKQ